MLARVRPSSSTIAYVTNLRLFNELFYIVFSSVDRKVLVQRLFELLDNIIRLCHVAIRCLATAFDEFDKLKFETNGNIC
jgi:hypothetical protein